MAELSREECLIIKTHGLEAVVGPLRTALRQVIEPDPVVSQTSSREDAGSDATGAVDNIDVQGIVSSLLTALLSHGVKFKLLHSRESGGTAGELARLFLRWTSGEINIAAFHPLMRAVVQRKSGVDNTSDLAIWKEVLQLTASASRLTPPPSINASFGGTPWMCSSASLVDSGQAGAVRDALREELKGCVYVDVPGIFEKYFEDRTWTQKSVDIYNAVKHTHVGGRWTTFPDRPTEDRVWSWWSSFQAEHMQASCSVYHTTESAKELKGSNSPGQLDILLKSRQSSVVVTDDGMAQHDWIDVRVIGELTVSTCRSDAKFLQLAKYARTIFTVQPRRKFVLGFILFHTKMELYTFDRSGVYRGEPFDIHQEPERFIRVICGYTMMSDDEVGLDTYVEREGDRLFVTVDYEGSGEGRRVEFDPIPIARRAAIVGRNTNCYTTIDGESIVKFSWVSANRTPSESEFLRLANERGVKGVPRLLGHRIITSTSNLRSSLAFSKKRQSRGIQQPKPSQNDTSFSSQSASLPPSESGRKRKSGNTDEGPSKKSRSNSQAAKLSQADEPDDSFNDSQLSRTADEPIDRVLYCQVTQPAGRPLTELRTPRMLLQVLRDAIESHRSLFLDGKILHRDVSDGNIIITEPAVNEGRFGMLIDIELGAIVIDGKNARTGGQRMTGTPKYMAIEVLQSGYAHAQNQRNIQHTYRHDLESFLYVFLVMCVTLGWPDGKKPKKDPFRNWHFGAYRDIATFKRGSMERSGFEEVVAEFSPRFSVLRGLARSLRDALFLRVDSLRTETPLDPPHVLYDKMLSAFNQSIEALPRDETA